MSSDPECGDLNNPDTLFGLRVASVFIILLCATAGTLFPVLAKKSTWLHVPNSLFQFAKYFGSGVIIATAFIHLLSPGLDELSSDCLSPAWQEYPYALALCLLSIMSIFILELVAFRWGTARLQKINYHHDAHGHDVGSHAAHGPENLSGHSSPVKSTDDAEQQSTHHLSHLDDSAAAQIIGVAILEFGVLLHSVLIGLTLAVDESFKVLFVVIIFHQTFEGLGLGSRLAFLKLPPRYDYVPIVAAIIYGLSTPIGIAAGLGIRSTYNPGSTTASIVSGVLDSLSAGILIYTGLVELLAHEFLFNKEMINGSNGKLAYAVGSMLFGCGIMALLGKWA
ncbi:ZIP-like iron-zinc transporter [Mycena epipterygia]|nr:ZIP-like iron-zinc transporter [Mycena epipterygia]